MGNDLAVVKDLSSGVLAWGFPRECHIRSGTLRKMPLAESDIPLAYYLRFEDLIGRTRFNDRGYSPLLLVCLAQHNATTHRMR